MTSGTDTPLQLALAIDPVVLAEVGGDADNVIDDGNAFTVTVSWTVTPPAAALLLTGTWTVQAYAESMGPGPEILIGSATVAGTGGATHSATLTVPAGTLASNAVPGTASGVYKVVAVVTYTTSLNAPTEITAFSEGPTFLIRTP